MEELHKKKNTLADESAKDESHIDTSALSGVGDEDDLTAALSGNPFMLGLTRMFIKVKNHIDIIPMILTVVTLMIIYVSMHDIIVALSGKMALNEYNAFLFFVNLILQIVLVLCYINVRGKRVSSTMKWIFFGLYLAVAAGSIWLDFDFISDANAHLSMFNSLNVVKEAESIYAALGHVKLHLVFLFISVGAAILAPIVQPFTRKLHVGIPAKKEN